LQQILIGKEDHSELPRRKVKRLFEDFSAFCGKSSTIPQTTIHQKLTSQKKRPHPPEITPKASSLLEKLSRKRNLPTPKEHFKPHLHAPSASPPLEIPNKQGLPPFRDNPH
jgi:hypothetical protein